MMKYLAIFLVVFLVEKSLSHKPYYKTCCANTTYNVSALVDRYQAVIADFPVPTLEAGDTLAASFRTVTFKASGEYGLSLVFNLLEQARNVGEKLIDAIKKCYYDLKCAIDSLPSYHYKRPNIPLENALNNMTEQIQTFLELKPGISQFELPELPPLPKQQIQLVSRTTERTADELFSNFEYTMYSVAAQIYAYWSDTFINSWQASQGNYEIVRTQVYDQILNCAVLGNYTNILFQVLEKRYLIQYNVKQEIWNCFKNASDQVITISKNYCESLEGNK